MNTTARFAAYVCALLVLLLAVRSVVYLHETPLARSAVDALHDAQDVARINGSYSFRSSVKQITQPRPSIANGGRSATEQRMLVTGYVDDAQQQAGVRVSSGEALLMEMRQNRGITEARERADSPWQSVGTQTLASNLNTLNILSSVRDAHVLSENAGVQRIGFSFVGANFASQFRQLLARDKHAGILHNAEWSDVAGSAALRDSTGDGVLFVDANGLPTKLELELRFAAAPAVAATTAQIVTVYEYANIDGLALKRAFLQPYSLGSFLQSGRYEALRLWILRIGAVFAFLAFVVFLRRYRQLVTVPLTIFVVVMQVYHPFSSIPRAVAAPAGQKTVKTVVAPQPPPPPRVFNPTIPFAAQGYGVAPQTIGSRQADQQVVASGFTGRAAVSADIDGDGLTNDQEAILRTNPSATDTDGDGLSDPQEVRLGTNPLVSDSDGDGLSDFVEVSKATTIGENTFYLSPLAADTNGDGVPDIVECVTKSTNPDANCEDSDGDRIPNFVDFDDDNDGVADSYDLVPSTAVSTVFTNTAPFRLRVNQTAAGVRPLLVELQFAPDPARLLSAQNATYDWPTNDTDGQVQRVNDDTFATNPRFAAAQSDAAAANGDMRLTAMLEVRIPVSATNYGNLPLLPCAATRSCGVETKYPAWIDISKLRAYGISPAWSVDPVTGVTRADQVTLTVPLVVDTDGSGTPVAFSAQMYYETGQTWAADHEYRLQWIVSALQDNCPTTPDTPCTAANRITTSTVVQSYYSDWKMTGLRATEHYGYSAAIISEDATKTVNRSVSSRRLQLSKINQVLSDAFLTTPFLDIDNPTAPNESLRVLFDNSANSAAPTTSIYGVDKSATKVQIVNYSTPGQAFELSTTEIPRLLNANLCSARIGIACTDGVPPTRALQDCLLQSDIECRPGILIASQSRERSTALGSDGTVSFDSAAVPTISRAVRGGLYAISDTATPEWIPMSQNDILEDVAAARASIPISAAPAAVSAQTWDAFQTGVVSSLVLALAAPALKLYQAEPAALTATVTQENFRDTTSAASWRDQVQAVTAVLGAQLGELLNVAEDEIDFSEEDMISGSFDASAAAISTANELTDLLADGGGKLSLSSLRSMGFVNLVTAAAMTCVVIAQLAGAAALRNPDAVKKITLAFSSTDLVLNTVSFAKDATKLYSLSKSTGNSISKIVAEAAEAWSALSKLDKLSKIIGYVGLGIALVATWGLAIYTAVKAEFPYQIGNAIAGAIGMTVAIIILAIIADIPVVGQIIAAVIAAIDAIAAIACATLSAKDRRTTQAQWLCGGITGLLANFFTPFASNLLVDPGDPFSFTSDMQFRDPVLDKQSLGFSAGNSIHNTLVITDYIQRMPFPSTWMSIPYFWQWNGLSQRNTAVTYQLDTTQIDKRSAIGIGSQYGQWVPSGHTTDEGASFSYQKTSAYTYQAPLTAAMSGVNSRMPDQILSRAFKTEKQTCFWIFIFFLFGGFILPICYIETESQNKYTNLNESAATRLDIFPATVTEFTRLRTKGTGYSFAWSPESANPPFPAFIDADNDGLTNSQERALGSRDDRADTDLDGITDDREHALGTSLTDIDTDADGLSDTEEVRYHTNPLLADSDADGLLDGEEIVRVITTNAKPLGIRTGGWDVVYGHSASGAVLSTWVGSDPLRADADGDGIIDLRERILGWSPWAKDSGEVIGVDGKITEAHVPALALTLDDSPGTTLSSMLTDAAMHCDRCPSVVVDAVTGVPTTGTTNHVLQFASGNALVADSVQGYTFARDFSFVAALKPTGTADQTILAQPGQYTIRRVLSKLVLRLFVEGTWLEYASDVALPTNVWTRVGVTYDGRTVVFYQNGVERSRAVTTGKLLVDGTAAPLVIGGEPAAPGAFAGWTGSMDNIGLYRSARPVAAMIDATNGVFDHTNDLVVRPGDAIVSQTVQTNKLLGRYVRGYADTRVSMESTAPPADIRDVTALVPAGSVANEHVIAVPGQARTRSGVVSYSNACVFPDPVFCARLDEKGAQSSGITNFTFTDTSRTMSDLQCASICPTYDTTRGWAFGNNSGLSTTDVVGNALTTRNFTIAFWVHPYGQSTTYRPFVTGNGIGLGLAVEAPQFRIGTSVLTMADKIDLDTWSHLAFVYENGIKSIWVNGVLRAADTSATPAPTTGFGTLKIGSSSASIFALSYLRDIEIYGSALNDLQLDALAHACDDPLLVLCAPMNGATAIERLRDRSVAGASQWSALTCVSCTVYGTAGLNLVAPVQLPAGTADVLNEHDFTIVVVARLASLADQLVFKTHARGGSEQLVLQIMGGVPTLSIADRVVTAGTVLADTWYTFVIRQHEDTLRLTVQDAIGGTFHAASSAATSAPPRTLADPVTIPATGQLGGVRLYRTALSDATVAAIGRQHVLFSLEKALNQAPMSDSAAVIVDSRTTVTDPQSTRYASGCSLPSVIVCLPYAGATTFNTASYRTRANITQSGNSTWPEYPPSKVIDGNVNTFQHTDGVYNPWLQFDLGASKELTSVVAYTRTDCCSGRYANSIVLISDTPIPACTGTSCTRAWYLAQAKDWRWLFCDSKAASCPTNYTQRAAVNFPLGTTARYVRIVVANDKEGQYLHFGEVFLNGAYISCEETGGCPTPSDGGSRFGGTTMQRLSPMLSKQIFEGDKNYTLSTWLRWDGTYAPSNVADATILSDNNVSTALHTRLRIGIAAGQPYIETGTAGPRLSAGTALSAGVWTHLAVVRNGNRREIYLDGVLRASDTNGAGLTAVRQLTIGATDPRTALTNADVPFVNIFNGSVRDFEIHTAALSQKQVQAIAVVPSYALQVPFEEVAGATAFSDVVTTTLGLRCTTICPESGLPGVIGNAVKFSGSESLSFGVSSDFVNAVQPSPTNATKAFTLSMWVKPASFGGSLLGEGVAAQQLHLGIDAQGYVTFRKVYTNGVNPTLGTAQWVQSTPLKSQSPLVRNQWAHIVLEVAGNAQTLTVNTTSSRVTVAPTWSYRLGTYDTPRIGVGYRGVFDQFTASQVPAANLDRIDTKPPVWNITFERGSTLDVLRRDVSTGITKTVLLNSVALPAETNTYAGVARLNYALRCSEYVSAAIHCPVGDVSGLRGNAAVFNGTDTLLVSHESIGDAFQTLFAGDRAVTMEFAVRPESASGTQSLVRYGTAGTTAFAIQLEGGKLVVRSGTKRYESNASIPLAWNAIAVVFAQSGLRVYINGNEDFNTSTENWRFVTDSTYRVIMGGQIDGAGALQSMFRGALDDFAITDMGLTSRTVSNSAQNQMAQAVSSVQVALVTVDADAPVVSLVTPTYASRLPVQFVASTTDATSAISAVTYESQDSDGRTIQPTIAAPDCADSAAGAHVCPTFRVSQDPNVAVEGSYTIRVDAYDAVANRGMLTREILVDTTPPVVTLTNTSPYTTSATLTGNERILTLAFTAADPVLRRSGSRAGSGVAAVTVFVKDSAGRAFTGSGVTARYTGSEWKAEIPIPFANPTGFYQVYAQASDQVGNVSAIQELAGSAHPIEVDMMAPRDRLVTPSTQAVGSGMLGAGAFSGVVSDYNDGRVAIQNQLALRLDFEGPDGESSFDNRGSARYDIDCTVCPIIAADTLVPSERVARFNVDGTEQSLLIKQTTAVASDTLSFATRLNATGTGTIVSMGDSVSPRLRLSANRSGSVVTVSASVNTSKGTVSLSSGDIGTGWNYLLYTETASSIALYSGRTPDTMRVVTATVPLRSLTPNLPDTIIGAIQTTASNPARDDFFHGYLDDIVLSRFQLLPADLNGPAVARGSGTTAHLTRFHVLDEGNQSVDQLAAKADYFAGLHQTTLPIVDSVHAVLGTRCLNDITIEPATCPTLVTGFTNQAIALNRATDGMQTGYLFTTTQGTSRAVALRFRITAGAASGLLATLVGEVGSATNNVLLAYDAERRGVTLRIADACPGACGPDLIDPANGFFSVDNDEWHTLILEFTGDVATDALTVVLDGQERLSSALPGHFLDARFGIGATAGVHLPANRRVATSAAAGVLLDDLSVFAQPLLPADRVAYGYGYSTVLRASFDDPAQVPGYTSTEDSPFALRGVALSGDDHFGTVPGIVGQNAVAFDANDRWLFRDPTAATFAAPTEPWASSLWVDPATANQTAPLLSGTYGDVAYQVHLVDGKPAYTLGGTTIVASAALTGPALVVVQRDGSDVRIAVDGTVVATGTVPAGGPTLPTARTVDLGPRVAATFNGTASTSLTDGDTTTLIGPVTRVCPGAELCTQTWIGDLGSATRIDAITLGVVPDASRAAADDYTVAVLDTLPSELTPAHIAESALWSTTRSATAAYPQALTLPVGTHGRYVIIQTAAMGTSSFVATDIAIQQYPSVEIAGGFAGTIDDVRIYRRLLSATDLEALQLMAWRQSTWDTTRARPDGYTWTRDIPVNYEATIRLDSATRDARGNTRSNLSAQSLWTGAIDTTAPVISQTTTLSQTTIVLHDRNLDQRSLVTACGAQGEVVQTPPRSLWTYTDVSLLDGTYEPGHDLAVTCSLGRTAQVDAYAQQDGADITALLYAGAVLYTAGAGFLRVIPNRDVLRPTPLELTLPGAATALARDAESKHLYAVVTTTSGIALLTYDIASSVELPVLRSTYMLPVATGIDIQHIDIAEDETHTYALMVDSGAPQRLWSVDVTVPAAPTLRANVSLSSADVFSMSTSGMLLALAEGVDGIALYRVAIDGGVHYEQTYQTAGYAKIVRFRGDDILVVDEDEDFTQAPVTVANTLRTISVAQTDVGTGARVYKESPTERTPFVHTLAKHTGLAAYQIRDIAVMNPQEVALISVNSDDQSEARMTIVDTAAEPPAKRTEVLLESDQPGSIVTNGTAFAVLDTHHAHTALWHYRLSDQRIGASACDIIGNCAQSAPTVSSAPELGLASPTETLVFFTNNARQVVPGSRRVEIYAEAPSGVASIALFMDDRVPVTHTVTLPTQTMVLTHFSIDPNQGSHTLYAEVTDRDGTTVRSNMVSFVADAASPAVALTTPVVGSAHTVNQFFVIEALVRDDAAISGMSVIDATHDKPLPFTMKKAGNSWNVHVFSTTQDQSADAFSLRFNTWDSVGNTTTVTKTVILDHVAPVVRSARLLKQTAAGEAAVKLDETIRVPSAVKMRWAGMTDRSELELDRLSTSVVTFSGTQTYSQTLPLGRAPIPAGISKALPAIEASKVTVEHTVGDTNGNRQTTPLGIFFVDTPLTPDYTLLPASDAAYRGFLGSGCSVLGTDRRMSGAAGQQFAVTWDAEALRLNWEGANWNIDGDLYIYFDTAPGGTLQAYRAPSATKTLTDSVALGDAFITLPVNIAARPLSGTATLKQYVQDTQARRVAAQLGSRGSTTVEGADYVLYVQSQTDIQLLHWDGTRWVDTHEQPVLRYEQTTVGGDTDIRVPFSSIGYDRATPFGLVAYATDDETQLPWATFPTTNPLGDTTSTAKVSVTALLNGYAWARLGDKLCPKTAAKNPDAFQLRTVLTSSPRGVTTLALSDRITNSDPAAISAVISSTNHLCSALESDSWCETVNAYAANDLSGSAILDGMDAGLATSDAPVVGQNAAISYNLQLTNNGKTPTKPLFALVQTYGGIWLTNSTSPVVVAGGLYTRNQSAPSGARDYIVLQLPAIAPGKTFSQSITAKIDTTKSRADITEFVRSNALAKIEIRITDASSVDTLNQARTIEWVNAALRIDTDPPTEVVPDAQTVLAVGNNALTGRVVDRSLVKAVELEYSQSNGTTNGRCTVLGAQRWTCMVTIAAGSTSVRYRVRATDTYGQQRAWSAWYSASVDRTAPTVALDATTSALATAAGVGGAAITVSGVVSDTQSLADIRICDSTVETCTTVASTQPPVARVVHNQTYAVPKEITSELCSTQPVASYTAYPLDINAADPRQRVASLSVSVVARGAQGSNINLWLRSPSGTLVALLTSTRPPTTDLTATFDSTATAPTTALTTVAPGEPLPIVKPDMSLDAFTNESLNGRWTVYGCNRSAAPHSTIQSASLRFEVVTDPTSQGAAWNYTLPQTSAVDGAVRTLLFTAVDTARNRSAPKALQVRVDTVPPRFAIIPRSGNPNEPVTVLQGETAPAFSGTAVDGSGLAQLMFHVYKNGVLEASLPIAYTETTASRRDEARFTTPQTRGLVRHEYTWAIAPQAFSFPAGEYDVQISATDRVGNTQTSATYQMLYETIETPSVVSVNLPDTNRVEAFDVSALINTGKGQTSLTAALDLDDAMESVVSDTTTLQYTATGVINDAAQARIPAELQPERVASLAVGPLTVGALDATGVLRIWGREGAPQVTTPLTITNLTDFAFGLGDRTDVLALSTTGYITSYNLIDNTPPQTMYDHVIGVAAGSDHSLALQSTGEVVAWGGANTDGQTTVPAAARTDVVQIGAGENTSVALRYDGSVVAWGAGNIASVPLRAQSSVKQIAVGLHHALALRTDGTVVAWGGTNAAGETTVPISATLGLGGGNEVVAVAAGETASAAILRDGTVLTWGASHHAATAFPASRLVAISATDLLVHTRSAAQTISMTLPANASPSRVAVSFSGLIPTRSYAITYTVTNAAGTTTTSYRFDALRRRKPLLLRFQTGGR